MPFVVISKRYLECAYSSSSKQKHVYSDIVVLAFVPRAVVQEIPLLFANHAWHF